VTGDGKVILFLAHDEIDAITQVVTYAFALGICHAGNLGGILLSYA
jgi:hypothetical protein